METQKLKSAKGFFKLFLLLLLLSIGAFAFFLYKRYGRIDLTFLERTPPTISFAEKITGIGAENAHITFTVADQDAGIDEVVVRVEQNGKRQDIFKKNYPDQRIKSDTVTVSDLSAKEKGLREGPAKILISAFDRSLFNNPSNETLDVMVDYTKPRLEVLTSQHNVAVGGTELVFYKVKGDDIALSGVRLNDSKVFRGFPAAALSDDFKGHKDIYFAFFALPMNFSQGKDKLTVFAQDKVGNTTSATFSYLVLLKKFREPDMKLTDSFLQSKFEELLPPYYKLVDEIPPNFNYESLTTGEKVEKFRLINNTYRDLLSKSIDEILKNSDARRYWDVPFIRPMSAAPTSSFGEIRKYSYEGVDAGGSVHAGVDLAATANSVVRAANSGKVIFADFLGIYGNAVIIDHGFGVASLYGHLSTISVQPGEEIQKDEQLGRSGQTGLAGGDHLHFEIRVGGVSVSPIEWWDQNWLQDHIERKIRSVADQITAQAAIDADNRS